MVGIMTDTPVKSLIDQWRPRRELADQIGADVAAIHKWAASGRIPSGWQGRVIQAAQERGLKHVTAEWMVNIHSTDVEQGAA